MATLGHRMSMPERSAPEKHLRFYIHFAVYLLVNIGLAILDFQKNPDHLWFYWVAGGWGIGVAFHALKAFGVITSGGGERKASSATDKKAGG